jgi:tetratricopeptide (TPR) repeat protein
MKIEEILESIGPMQSANKTDEQRINEVLSHPFFMDSCKEEDMEQETMSALQSLVFDGTPEEIAENFKEHGNACFKVGKLQYRDAIHYYTQGILAKAQDPKLNSVLHSNRAAVNLEMMNYRSCLYDCALAIKFNPENIKAYFRSVKALYALDRIEEGIDCCEKGLVVSPDNQALKEYLVKLKKRRGELDELHRIAMKKQEAKENEERQLMNALRARGYQYLEKKDEDENLVRFQHPDAPINRIQIAEEGELTFPVVFLYPEYNQSDTISTVYETDTLYAHFQNMFQDPSPWDPSHHYHPDTLDVYFETFPKQTSESPKLISVLKSVEAKSSPSQSAAHRYVYVTLQDILSHPDFRIVNGVVTLIVLARNTPFNLKYRKQFRKIQ